MLGGPGVDVEMNVHHRWSVSQGGQLDHDVLCPSLFSFFSPASFSFFHFESCHCVLLASPDSEEER